MAQATTTQKAGAKRFNAVPPMVWSAFRLMAAKASNREKSIPATPAMSAASATPSWEVNTLSPQPAASNARRKRVEAKAPMIMMPSSARLITPDRSEYMPPRATSIKGIAKQMVRLIILAQVPTLISQPPPFSRSCFDVSPACRTGASGAAGQTQPDRQ